MEEPGKPDFGKLNAVLTLSINVSIEFKSVTIDQLSKPE